MLCQGQCCPDHEHRRTYPVLLQFRICIELFVQSQVSVSLVIPLFFITLLHTLKSIQLKFLHLHLSSLFMFKNIFASTVWSPCLSLSTLSDYSDFILLQLKPIIFVVYTKPGTSLFLLDMHFFHQVLYCAAHQRDWTPYLRKLVGSAIEKSNMIGTDHSARPRFLQNTKAWVRVLCSHSVSDSKAFLNDTFPFIWVTRRKWAFLEQSFSTRGTEWEQPGVVKVSVKEFWKATCSPDHSSEGGNSVSAKQMWRDVGAFAVSEGNKH